MMQAIEHVAAKLGNTPSVCRKCYVHPIVLDSYLDGTMMNTLEQRAEDEMEHLSQLQPEEAAVMTLLMRKLNEKR